MTREEAGAPDYGNPGAAIDLIVELAAVVPSLRAKVAELERKLALRTKDSSNSSKPPSSDGPAAKPKARPPKKSKKRKRGALPGRKGNNRDLIPIDEVDAVEEIVHAACEGCHEALTSSTNPEEGKYLRSQVVDIPETTLHVTEYRLPRVGCDCAAETWAELPSQRSVWIRPSSHGFCRASDRCSPSHRTRRGWHEILNPKIRGHHTQLA